MESLLYEATSSVCLLSSFIQFALEFIIGKTHAVETVLDLVGNEIHVCEEEAMNGHASLTVPVRALLHCRLWRSQQVHGFTSDLIISSWLSRGRLVHF